MKKTLKLKLLKQKKQKRQTTDHVYKRSTKSQKRSFTKYPWVSQLTHIITDDDLDGISAGAILLHESPNAKVIFGNSRKLIRQLIEISTEKTKTRPVVAVVDIGTDGQDIQLLQTTITNFAKRGKIIYIDHHKGSENLQVDVTPASQFINYSDSNCGAAALITANLTANPKILRLKFFSYTSLFS